MARPLPFDSRHVRSLVVTLIVTLLLSSNPLRLVEAAAGDLDISFGSGGKVITDVSTDFDEAHAVAVQTDGKIVVAGFAQPTDIESRDFAILRYNNQGGLDATFGNGGKVRTDFIGGFDEADAVAIQADGKIIAAGAAEVFNGNAFELALARYNPNGSPDKSFGVGGKVTTNVIIGGRILAIALQSNGKIVAAGFTNTISTGPDMAVARFNTDGSLDQDFGASGKVITDFAGGTDSINAVAMQPDGKIVAAGFTQVTPAPFSFDFALVRYDTNGNLDNSFGSGGKVTTEIVADATDEGRGLVIQPNGKIVVAGKTRTSIFSDFALAGYNPDGSLDSSFGTGGRVVTQLVGNSAANALLLQPNGKLIAAGFTASSSGDFALVRYASDGAVDLSFGAGGVVATDFQGGPEEVLALAWQPDGKIVAVGLTELSTPFTTRDFAVARYYTDGGFDICLQDDSTGSLLQLNSTTGEYQFTNCSGLTFDGTGSITRKGNIITLQQSGPDRRVLARIDGGTTTGTASVQVFSLGTTFTITDRNRFNNTCSCGEH